MSAIAPVAIGTRGTVGSLVRKEIEYFSTLEMDTRGSSSGKAHVVDMTSCSGHSSRRSGSWFSMRGWRRWKKERTSVGIVPKMCSAVEVADDSNRISGFHYRNLKNERNVCF